MSTPATTEAAADQAAGTTTIHTAETKVAAEGVSAHMAKLAAFVNRDTYIAVIKSAPHNAALLTYVNDQLFAAMKLAHPTITGDSNSFKLDTGASFQLLILVRMLYMSAISGKLSGETEIKDAAAHFADSSIESNLWRWATATLTGAGEAWATQKMIMVSDAVESVSNFYKKVDEASTATEFIDVVLENVIATVCTIVVDLCGADVDAKEKKAVTVDDTMFNGILRLLNRRSAKPVANQFFVDLFQVGHQFPATQKFWNKELKVAKPPKVKKAAGAKKTK